MSDYNDGKLAEPCLRLPYGGAEYASVELGDGTGFVRLSECEQLRAENAGLKELVVKMRYNGAPWTDEARKYIDERMCEFGIEADG